MHTLYLIATPIGNLEDITLRALRLLREVSLIAAEDTRHTKRLLQHYDIQTRCISFHEHSQESRLDEILTALAQGDVALVSDAGTPLLSDPGYELVKTCIAAGFPISPIPGPAAPIAALAASGLPTDQVLYLGFLPRRSNERCIVLGRFVNLPATLICFEAPHRLIASLEDMLSVLGDRRIVLAREITKIHEEFVRLPLSQAIAYVKQHRPRGEYTLVIEGFRGPLLVQEQIPSARSRSHSHVDEPTHDELSETILDKAAIIQRLQELHKSGHSSSSAARMVAREWGIHKREVYTLWINESDDSLK